MEQKEQFNLFEMYLQELQTIVSCEEAENKELTARIRKGDVLAKKRLVEGNLKLALDQRLFKQRRTGRGFGSGGKHGAGSDSRGDGG